MISNRIEHLKKELSPENHIISLESSLLYTKSYKNNANFSYMIKHALAISNILENIDISINTQELIIGNIFSKSNAINIFPVIPPKKLYSFLNENNFYMSAIDKLTYNKYLYPYWNSKSFENYLNKVMDSKIKKLNEISLIKLNTTFMTTIDFKTILHSGLNNIIKKLQKKSNQYKENDFYRSSLILLTSIQKYIIRYADLAYTMAYSPKHSIYKNELLTISKISRKISYNKPDTFHEACQLIWFLCIVFQYELGNASINLGCFDQYMIDLYKKDILNGFSPNFLAEILNCLWIKLNTKNTLISENNILKYNSYNLTIGGTDSNGNSAINPLSFLILKICKNLNLPFPKLNIRISDFTKKDFLYNACNYTAENFSTINFFNDEIIIPSLLNRGISLKDCRNYSIAQNNQPYVPNKTSFVNNNTIFDFNKLLQITLITSCSHYNNFEEIINDIKSNIKKYLNLTIYGSRLSEKSYLTTFSSILLSCFTNNCIETGTPLFSGGTKHNFSIIDSLGLESISTFLCYLNELVFIKKDFTLNQFIFKTKNNLNDITSKYFLNEFPKYCISLDEIYNLACDLLKYFCTQLEQYTNCLNGTFLPSTCIKIPSYDCISSLKSINKLDNMLLNENKLEVTITPSCLQENNLNIKLLKFLKSFIRFKIQNLEYKYN